MARGAKEAVALLRQAATPGKREVLQRFFKTGPGEYGEGDVFLGVRMPDIRRVAGRCRELSASDIDAVLQSAVHEERMLALLLVVDRYEHAGTDSERRRWYDFYIRHMPYINNWDLVDVTAPRVVGRHLYTRSREPLTVLARSDRLWDRRIAIVATHWFIRHNEFDDTLRLARQLLSDRHDLMQKATGWMLREVGKRDEPTLTGFLDAYAAAMPRTMLRYAIERLPEPRRTYYLGRRAGKK